QRVAIARALTGHPQLIMADEPTAALDSHSGHTVMELLRQLAKEEGCTVLMV
ncbi:MAG TPA: ABC transporter ATP-binding protein, partial [Cyanobacteria bacterium UBA8553]|nr:ABC transporter ATP-binding protein [Cyanobacteria bacterium UBA8553]